MFKLRFCFGLVSRPFLHRILINILTCGVSKQGFRIEGFAKNNFSQEWHSAVPRLIACFFGVLGTLFMTFCAMGAGILNILPVDVSNRAGGSPMYVMLTLDKQSVEHTLHANQLPIAHGFQGIANDAVNFQGVCCVGALGWPRVCYEVAGSPGVAWQSAAGGRW